MTRSLVASLFLAGLALASSATARTSSPDPALVGAPAPHLNCGCNDDFTCLFESFGCPGFTCEHLHGPFGGGVCVPLDR